MLVFLHFKRSISKLNVAGDLVIFGGICKVLGLYFPDFSAFERILGLLVIAFVI